MEESIKTDIEKKDQEKKEVIANSDETACATPNTNET